MTRKIPIAVIEGATASGKTELAIRIAETFGGEIVSADSMQIYKHMDIGTAKPTAEERARCPHHLIDFVEPDERFSAADYAALAHRAIADITSRGRLPIICGGTGLYIDSVVNDVDFGDGSDADYALRRELAEIAECDGKEALVEILRRFDPESAEAIHPNNTKRLIRAIEYYRLTGKTMSEHRRSVHLKESRYDTVKFMISYPREELYERINTRVDRMIADGLEEEVRGLIAMGCTRDMNSMQGIGYKEMTDLIDGKRTLSETTDAIKQASRRYAKRQLTWFRRDEEVHSLPPAEALTETSRVLEGFLNKCKAQL